MTKTKAKYQVVSKGITYEFDNPHDASRLHNKLLAEHKIEVEEYWITRRAEAQKAMAEVNQDFGDAVYYNSAGLFMTSERFEGIIIKRNGMPYVRLNEVAQGRRTLKWNKGWMK